jgi:hypothetical protein
MIIPTERLNREDVRRGVEEMVERYVGLRIEGYKCDSRAVVNVLVKAAVEETTIESTCDDLSLGMGSNTIN